MKGFTLIELMVTITISLFVIGGVIVNYNAYNSSQVVKQAALTFKNDFRFIQSKAASGQKPSAGCGSLTGWNVSFTNSSYTYQPNCDGIPVNPVTTIELAPGVVFSSKPATPVTVYVLSRGTSLAATNTIILTGSGKSYALQINPSGDINDLGYQ